MPAALQLLVLLLTGLLSTSIGIIAAESGAQESSRQPKIGQGQFGADLGELARFYTPPQVAGESNYYFDMWAGGNLRQLISSTGLTNNHALFVNSHGKAIVTRLGKRYAYYPHQSRLKPNQRVPYFAAADLARVIGPDSASNIHNIVIAGCNAEGAFSGQALREYFVKATNIMHAPAGEPGCQTMLLQTLCTDSANVQTIYEVPAVSEMGRAEYRVGHRAAQGATCFRPYVADLFMPCAPKPFRRQIAGRELLDPALTPATESAIPLSMTLPEP